jgi:hypothetical protein
MRRRRAHSSLLVLTALVLAQSAGAADVPFGAQQVISTAAATARSVFAADVDGDLDALSASQSDDKIAWYENTDGAGSFGTLNVPAIGEKRLETFYRIGSVHRAGGKIVCGSDWFVSSLNPLDAIEVGVRRQDPYMPEGAPSLNPGEAVDLATMIQAYTIDGAYVMHQEESVGSIEIGKRADLIVLDRDLFEIPAAEINEANVLLTLFDGRPVHNDGICSEEQ